MTLAVGGTLNPNQPTNHTKSAVCIDFYGMESKILGTFANKAVKEKYCYDAMTRTCMFKFLKGHIEYLTQRLQPAKCIAKEQNVIMKRPPENYGSTADSRSENKELMIKISQAKSRHDACEKLRQCEFTE